MLGLYLSTHLPTHALTAIPALAVRMHPPRIMHTPSYHIYIDGSYTPDNPRSSAWAAVLIAEDSTGFSFGGALYHNAQDSMRLPLFNSTASSTTPELAGMVWAGILATSLPHHCHITIHTDSTNAILNTNTPPTTGPLAHIAQLANHTVTRARRLHHVALRHVPAHCGHPWNELADDLAKHSAQGHNTPLPPTIVAQLSHSPALQWTWLLDAPTQVMTAYPPITQDPDGTLHMRFTAKNPQVPLSHSLPAPPTGTTGGTRTAPCNTTPTDGHTNLHHNNSQAPTSARHPKHWQLTLNVFSHNITTLRDDTAATKRRGNIGKLVR